MWVPKMAKNQISLALGNKITRNYLNDVFLRTSSGRDYRRTVSPHCEVDCAESCCSDPQISSRIPAESTCKAFHRNVFGSAASGAFSEKIVFRIRCTCAVSALNVSSRACWKRPADWMISGNTDRDIPSYSCNKKKKIGNKRQLSNYGQNMDRKKKKRVKHTKTTLKTLRDILKFELTSSGNLNWLNFL